MRSLFHPFPSISKYYHPIQLTTYHFNPYLVPVFLRAYVFYVPVCLCALVFHVPMCL